MDGALQSTRLFDLEEAERMLPLVRAIIKGIMDDHGERRMLADRMEALRSAGEMAAARVLEREIDALGEKIREAVGEIEDLGAEFKGVELGLVDFPSVRDGEIVYLCWQHGEERIDYWHPVHTGYAGRRPIDRD